VASWEFDPNVYQWEATWVASGLHPGEAVPRPIVAIHPRSIFALTFAKEALVSASGTVIRVHDGADDGVSRVLRLDRSLQGLTSVAAAADGTIAAASRETIALWRPDGTNPDVTWTAGCSVTAVAVAAPGRVVAGCSGGALLECEPAGCRSIGVHANDVSAVVFDAAHDHVMSADRAGEVRSWRGGEEDFAEAGAPVTALAIGAAGTVLVAGDQAGNLRRWRRGP
jgi:hypothetical protein